MHRAFVFTDEVPIRVVALIIIGARRNFGLL